MRVEVNLEPLAAEPLAASAVYVNGLAMSNPITEQTIAAYRGSGGAMMGAITALEVNLEPLLRSQLVN